MKAEREERIIPPNWPVECVKVRLGTFMTSGVERATLSIGFPHRGSLFRGVKICTA